VDQKLRVGQRYFEWLRSKGQTQKLLNGSYLDFGAGWHPSIPLLYYSLGCARQRLFDLAPVLDRTLVSQTVDTVLALLNDPAWIGHGDLKRLPPKFTGDDWRGYLKDLGISYHAPYADVFPELAGSLDVVTSTQVLLHIPREPLRWCFEQIYRSLKPGGVFLATIHLRDLMVGIHNHRSKYNQLRYSTETWDRWINSKLMSYNRLRAPDYRQLLEGAGFAIEHFEIEGGTPADFRELDAIRVAECFKKYSREDLAATHLFFVAQKP
jgi:SAM-dependent methyltransferase